MIAPYGEKNVRLAAIEDAAAIAHVHVESSRAAYRQIYPQSWLSRKSVEDRALFWKQMLTAADPRSVICVACDEAQGVVGFLAGGEERTGRLGCDAELHAIYLLPAAQRRGLGTLLVRRFVAELGGLGLASMAVWVLARNPATKFYEALGGAVIDQQEMERGGESFVKIAYGWSDLSNIRA